MWRVDSDLRLGVAVRPPTWHVRYWQPDVATGGYHGQLIMSRDMEECFSRAEPGAGKGSFATTTDLSSRSFLCV